MRCPDCEEYISGCTVGGACELDRCKYQCKCCGLELNEYEIEFGENSCMHCVKGNCEICGSEDYDD